MVLIPCATLAYVGNADLDKVKSVAEQIFPHQSRTPIHNLNRPIPDNKMFPHRLNERGEERGTFRVGWAGIVRLLNTLSNIPPHSTIISLKVRDNNHNLLGKGGGR